MPPVHRQGPVISLPPPLMNYLIALLQLTKVALEFGVNTLLVATFCTFLFWSIHFIFTTFSP